jgi:hypothetical protein
MSENMFHTHIEPQGKIIFLDILTFKFFDSRREDSHHEYKTEADVSLSISVPPDFPGPS